LAGGRLCLPAGLAAGAGGLAADLVARPGFGGLAARVGERRAVARFGGAARLAGFLEAFARLAVALAGLAAARPFRAVRPLFLDVAPAARRAGRVGEEELRFARPARPPVGRFLAMSV
jgi:hypothetical protein